MGGGKQRNAPSLGDFYSSAIWCGQRGKRRFDCDVLVQLDVDSADIEGTMRQRGADQEIGMRETRGETGFASIDFLSGTRTAIVRKDKPF